jgi:phenylalanyl-tRNA synthetase beta chain
MLLIPQEYLKECLFLKIVPEELAEKLTYYGLETKIIKRGNNIYFEFDSLPNRSDLLSWWGIIHEIGVLLNCQIKPFDSPIINKSEEKLIEVKIATDKCWEFHSGLVKDVVVKESPAWVRECLEANNVRSINNIVDIANLVMLETGQPLHIFDYDTLPKRKIFIQEVQEKEIMTALHGQKLTLCSGDVVINSDEQIIDLAGIIGAQVTSISSQTKNVFIECALFNPISIKETAKRLNISNLASQYFSRQANLFFTPSQALSRVISLIIDSYEGNLNSATIFTYKKAVEKKKKSLVSISQEFITKKVGQMLSEQVVEDAWQRLGFSYWREGNIYYISIPSYRLDITSAEDVLEELLKIYDYNKIISSQLTEFNSTFFSDDKKEREKKQVVRFYLASCGWQEIITYSLISEKMKEEFSEGSQISFYQLLMPKNEYHKYYRQALLASHLKALKYNLSRSNNNLSFFEISSVYSPDRQEEILILSGVGKLLDQPFHQLVQKIDFYWLKGVLENIFKLWQINSEVSFVSTSLDYLYSPQSAEVFLGKQKIGFLGRIQPLITHEHQIDEPVFVSQISLTKIFDYLRNSLPKFNYRPVSSFPTSTKDLSFIFSESVNYNEITKEIKMGGNQ